MLIESKIAGTVFTDPELCPLETFSSIGSLISPEEICSAFESFHKKKLKRKWDCIKKAQWAISKLSNKERGLMELHIGACFVLSPSTNSSYGFAYYPPLEFHAWAFSRKQLAIYDLALPGVILSGLSLGDEIGPYLENIEPVVMAEKVTMIPNWIRYKLGEMIEGHDALTKEIGVRI